MNSRKGTLMRRLAEDMWGKVPLAISGVSASFSTLLSPGSMQPACIRFLVQLILPCSRFRSAEHGDGGSYPTADSTPPMGCVVILHCIATLRGSEAHPKRVNGLRNHNPWLIATRGCPWQRVYGSFLTSTSACCSDSQP